MNTLHVAVLVLAQINVGSDGSDGAFAFTPDQAGGAIMTIDLTLAAPASWTTPSPVAGRGVYDADEWAVVFKYTNVTVPAGKTVRFANHPTRAPVVWLSQGDVVVDGEVDLDGASGHDWDEIPGWTEPGPGGFRGGRGWSKQSAIKGSAGFGPGGGPVAGKPGSPAGYAIDGWTPIPGFPVGKSYGNEQLTQLLGGSGGGTGEGDESGRPGCGAGGGAILIAADTTVRVSGSVHADGGTRGAVVHHAENGGPGSGGAVRLVADEVELVDSALVRCLGKSTDGLAFASHGRIRIEANVHVFGVLTDPVPSVGLPAPVFSPTKGTVRIASVDGVPAPADPESNFIGFFADVTITDPGTKSVTILGEGIPDQTPVELRVTDTLGDVTVYPATLAATGQPGETSATIQAVFPATVTVLQARAVLP